MSVFTWTWIIFLCVHFLGHQESWPTASRHQRRALLFCFTLLSFSEWLAWLMLMSSSEFPLRGVGARWDVSWGRGLMLYWTLEVHFTEKNLEPGGALLRPRETHQLVYTTQTCFIKHTVWVRSEEERVCGRGTSSNVLAGGKAKQQLQSWYTVSQSISLLCGRQQS